MPLTVRVLTRLVLKNLDTKAVAGQFELISACNLTAMAAGAVLEIDEQSVLGHFGTSLLLL